MINRNLLIELEKANKRIEELEKTNTDLRAAVCEVLTENNGLRIRVKNYEYLEKINALGMRVNQNEG